MEKIRVSAVSYTNTLPFIHGLRHSAIIDRIELSLNVPSACADELIRGEADLGIVPVAALLDIQHGEIISDYCIGANGPVNSVFIFSEKPIDTVETLRLDAQSKTSNGLAQILLLHHWKKEVTIVSDGAADAYVEIGDRTFGKRHAHPYVYDLAQHWQYLTGLPFAFAVWVANKALSSDFLVAFNDALAYGLANREQLISQLPRRPDFDYYQYLMEQIDYRYDEQKQQAVATYLNLLRTVEAVPVEH